MGSHACGAAVISDHWLVTAAHCVGFPARLMSVVLGMHDRETLQKGSPTSFDVAMILKHPGWEQDSSQGFPNDIALIQISSAADLTGAYIKSVALPAVGESFEGNSECYITGWGKMGMVSALPNVLQEANVDIYTQDYCIGMMGEAMVHPFHICVGKKGTSGACSGDSGGPLVCKVGDSFKLGGVTSYGLVTCSTKYPSVYTRISFYRNWIQENSGV